MVGCMLLFLATFHTLLWLGTQAVEGKDSEQDPGTGYLTASDGSVDMPVSLMLKLEPEGGRPGNFVGGALQVTNLRWDSPD